jgi:flagellar biosynthetic protein FliR
MEISPLYDWAMASLLLSLRIAPVFAFAPPFTLTPAPTVFRMLFGVGIAASLIAAHPAFAKVSGLEIGPLAWIALRELAMGAMVVLIFQLMFAALYVAGRTIDIQAGFGLVTLIDPTTQAQTPMVGTLFALAAGAVFFALDGHADLLRIFAASLDVMPIGAEHIPDAMTRLANYASLMFITGFGVAGGTVLALFLADLAIAMLSRTAPQLNVLVLGFQAKTLLLLIILPATLGFGGAMMARMIRITLEAIPRLM